MRIEQLEYFRVIARVGSMRRAAEELHLSQPALSESMRSLEEELGVALLDRHRSGTRTSEAGRDLLPDVVAVLDAVEHLRQAASSGGRAGNVLRLGTVNTATESWIVPAIGEFSRLHPGTVVEVVSAGHDEIERMLVEGSLDFGLVHRIEGDELPARLEVLDLLSGRAGVCVNCDSEQAAQKSVALADLATLPLVVMRSGYAMHRLLTRLLNGREPQASCSADGAEMSKLMVAQGLGAALLPDFSVVGDPLERAGVITWRPLVGARATVTLGLARRRGRTLAPGAAAFVDVLLASRPGLTR
ncbi:MAG: LysR family transcriptional regulator [Sporichthyaceae bacterium]